MMALYIHDSSIHVLRYAASHKNFSCAGICYAIIRRDLITRKNQMKMIPTMCNWVKFQEAPNKIYNVPVLFSVWLGAMVCEWMIEKGGIPYFEKLAIERSSLLYDRNFDIILTHSVALGGGVVWCGVVWW